MTRERPGRDQAAHELAESVALGRLAAAATRAGVPHTLTGPGGAGAGPEARVELALPALVLQGERHEVVITYPAALADRGMPVCYEADVWPRGRLDGQAGAEEHGWLGTLYCGLGLDASPSALDGLVALLLDLPSLTEAILAQTPDPDVALRLLVAVEPRDL
ncbi:MAG TPA: hypothetical protein VFS29_02585 [Motilibacteraceae bacterium]|nr:hypothetical protein [Motilibacteraceae bacterium]